ncbi:uncharacterized protein LOC135476494 [Liolophura sinensis]|uniref:uncharacterized protein LOC135476494 n=1 Tax=Liolophura sinensis TaxID=3198878 RepID=UPI00315882E4
MPNQGIAMHWILAPKPNQPSLDVPIIPEVLPSSEYLSFLRKKTALLRQRHLGITFRTLSSELFYVFSTFNCVCFAFQSYSCCFARISESLKKTLLSTYKLDTVASIQWGVTHEKSALQQYEMCGGKVEQTGLWMHECGVLAASPDGLVIQPPSAGVRVYGPDSCPPEIIEVKRPFSIRHSNIRERIAGMKDPFLGKCGIVIDFYNYKWQHVL